MNASTSKNVDGHDVYLFVIILENTVKYLLGKISFIASFEVNKVLFQGNCYISSKYNVI